MPSNMVKRVGVVGSGIMGAGIAEVAAKHEHEVVLRSREQAAADAMLTALDVSLGKQVAKGKLDECEREAVLARITTTTELDDLYDCDLVIESVVEDLEVKQRLFRELDQAVRADALLVTNTSTLPVIDLAVVTGRPERVCGVHFFNPAPVMSLVEIVRPLTADDATIELAKAFALDCGKEPVIVEDRAGFIVNALLFPYLNNAVRMYEQGTATMRGHRHGHEGRLRLPDGTVQPARPRRAGHLGRHPRRAVRGVPRRELRARALAAPDGDRRTARPEVGPRLLHVRPLTDWGPSSSKGGGPDAPGDTVRARALHPPSSPSSRRRPGGACPRPARVPSTT